MKQHKTHRQNQIVAVVVAVGLAIAGLSLLFTLAAATTIQREAEAAPPTTGADTIDDSLASGGQALQFGGVGSTPPPAATGVWSSGAVSDDLDAFADWRGRPLDNTGLWPNRSNWEEISNPDIYGNISNKAQYKHVWVGMAMFPDGGSFGECNSGAYDGYFQQAGAVYAGLNRDGIFVRLGWEANGNWYAWSIGDDVEGFKSCYRRLAGILKAAEPRLKMEWNMNRDSHMDRSVADAYPGDDIVDVVGVDFYDQWPSITNQADWDADYMREQNGGPVGLGSWLAFAKAHGKPLAFPEWGVSGEGTGGTLGSNNPFYIAKMYEFFSTNAADIAYETYFNTTGGAGENRYVIFPAGGNGDAAAEYQRLWSQSPR